MKGAPGGFTIIEVLIVLGISSVMLASAITVFSNRRDTTAFSQAVYDLQSKFRSMANDVSSQSVPGLQAYSCTPVLVGTPPTMRPRLLPGSSTGQSCIYLGQALQIINTTGTSLYSYPVFGLRTVYNGAIETTNTPTTVAQANPSPAVNGLDNIEPNLIGTYQLSGGLKTLWAKVGGSGTDRDLIGLYSNLLETNTSGNEVTLYTYDTPYNSVANVTTTYDNIKNCVRGGCASTALGSSSWQLCVSDNRRSAILSAYMTPTGANTRTSIKTTADCT